MRTTTIESAVVRTSSGLMWFGVGAIVSAVVAIVAAAATGNPLFGFIAFVGVAGVVFVMSRAGVRGTLGAVLLFLVAPGVLGETSFARSMVGIVGLLVLCLTYKPTRRATAGPIVLMAGFVLLPGVGMLLAFGAPVAGVFGVAAIIAGLAVSRREFVDELLGGLTWVLGAFVASFVLTYLLGQFASPIATFSVEQRNLALHLPFTVTSGGQPFIPGTRRLSPLTGEPGLVAFFAVPLLAVVFARGIGRSRRIWTLAVLVGLVAFSQSFATVFAVAGALFVGAIAVLWRSRRFLSAVAIIIAALLVAPTVFSQALGEKAVVAAASFTDRGIANLGSASTAIYGNINLLTTFANTPVLAICMVIALGFGLIYALRTLGGTVAFLAFAVVAVFAQPSQWHAGAWLMLVCGLVFANEQRSADRVFGTGLVSQKRPKRRAPHAVPVGEHHH